MSVTLHRWGNSVGLRLPKPLLEQLGLKEGSEVDIKIEGNPSWSNRPAANAHHGGVAGGDDAGQ